METIVKPDDKGVSKEIKTIKGFEIPQSYKVIKIDKEYYYAQKVYYTLILGLMRMVKLTEEDREIQLHLLMYPAGRSSNKLLNVLNIIYKNQYCNGSKYRNNKDNLVYIINEYCRKYNQPNILDFCYLPLSLNILDAKLIIHEDVFNEFLERKIKETKVPEEKPSAGEVTGQTPATEVTGQTPATEVTSQTPSSVFTAQTPSSVFTAQTPATEVTGQTPATEVTGQTPATEVTGQTPATEVTGQTPSTEVKALTIGVQERFILVDFKTLYYKLGIINPNDPNYESLLNKQKPIGLPIFFSFLYGCGFRLTDERYMNIEEVKNALTLYLTIDKVAGWFISLSGYLAGDTVESVFKRLNYSNVFGNNVYTNFFTDGFCDRIINDINTKFDKGQVSNKRFFIYKKDEITKENAFDRINIFTFFYDLFINNRDHKRGGKKTKRRRRSGIKRRKLTRTNSRQQRSIRWLNQSRRSKSARLSSACTQCQTVGTHLVRCKSFAV